MKRGVFFQLLLQLQKSQKFWDFITHRRQNFKSTGTISESCRESSSGKKIFRSIKHETFFGREGHEVARGSAPQSPFLRGETGESRRGVNTPKRDSLLTKLQSYVEEVVY